MNRGFIIIIISKDIGTWDTSSVAQNDFPIFLGNCLDDCKGNPGVVWVCVSAVPTNSYMSKARIN